MGKIILLLGLTVSLANCLEPEVYLLVPLLPKIAVDACKSDSMRMHGEQIGGTKDCSLPLGEIDISGTIERKVVVSNPSGVDLNVERIWLQYEGQRLFRLLSYPTVIKPGQSSVVIFRVRPTDQAYLANILSIKSDAANVLPGGLIEVNITANGVDHGLPKISFVNEICDFGNVSLNTKASCKTTVKNRGDKPLIFDELSFLAGSLQGRPAFHAKNVPVVDEILESGATREIEFEFSPVVAGSYRQLFVLKTNDVANETSVITLKGNGLAAPIAQCSIESVNDKPYVAGMNIEPLAKLKLTGNASYSPELGVNIAEYAWSITKRPTSSHVDLSSQDTAKTGFLFGNDKFGIDLAGDYAISLFVTDSLGVKSSTPCLISFKAIPREKMHLQLVWDTPFGDMDIHLAKLDSNGHYCVSAFKGAVGPLAERCILTANLECNYQTCRPQIVARPRWDKSRSGYAPGDPRLDIDDLTGFGPENINIDTPLTGSYLISVNHFQGNETALNTIRIYLFGELVAEMSKKLLPKEWWEVAIIHWPVDQSGYPCIENLSTNPNERTRC